MRMRLQRSSMMYCMHMHQTGFGGSVARCSPEFCLHPSLAQAYRALTKLAHQHHTMAPCPQSHNINTDIALMSMSEQQYYRALKCAIASLKAHLEVTTPLDIYVFMRAWYTQVEDCAPCCPA